MPPILTPLALLSFAALAACPVFAQSPGRMRVATAAASVSPAYVARGGRGVLTVTLSVAPQFHVNAHKTTDPDLIATTFTPTAAAGVHYGPAHYPVPRLMTLDGKPTPVYTGRAIITVPFTVSRSAPAGRLRVGGQLTYQGCNATSCYPPQTVSIGAAVSTK